MERARSGRGGVKLVQPSRRGKFGWTIDHSKMGVIPDDIIFAFSHRVQHAVHNALNTPPASPNYHGVLLTSSCCLAFANPTFVQIIFLN